MDIFFDTTVLVAASEQSHPHAQAWPALRRVAAGQDQGIMGPYTVLRVRYPSFWHTEMLPASDAGIGHLSLMVSRSSSPFPTDPYNTHPPLKDRVAALRAHAIGPQETDRAPMIGLELCK